jgi:hypothetical protein
VVVPDQKSDSRQRLYMTLFGMLWLALFFIPFGQASFGMVMSWDLLKDVEGMSYLVSWPLMMAVLFLVLGVVGPLPAWVRSVTSLILGVVVLAVFGASTPGGPFGPDLRFVFSGGAPWLLMFPVVGLGLLTRAQAPRSIAARIMVAIGLVLGLIAYLTGRDGEPTLVSALLKYFDDPESSRVFARVMILIPLFLLIAATVGFRMPEGDDDPARPWARTLGWILLLYLPGFLLLHGIVLSAEAGSAWFFVMFFRLAAILAGIFATLSVAVPWAFDQGQRRVVPYLFKSR